MSSTVYCSLQDFSLERDVNEMKLIFAMNQQLKAYQRQRVTYVWHCFNSKNKDQDVKKKKTFKLLSSLSVLLI